MITNQSSSGPSQATRVLFHILFSLLASGAMAGITAGANYLYTGGNSINITVVGSAATAAFFVFLVTHAPSVLKSNQGQLLAGVHDILLDVHQPILTYLAQLMQQTNQIQQVAQATSAQVAQVVQAVPSPLPRPPKPPDVTSYARATGVGELVPISQQTTQVTPAVNVTPNYPSAQMPAINAGDLPTLTFDLGGQQS